MVGVGSRPAIVRVSCVASRPSWTPISISPPCFEVANSWRHTIGNARWEAGNVRARRRPALLRRRAGTPARQADPGAGRRRPHIPRTPRRRRCHRAVELSDADRRLGIRAGARGRQHRPVEASRGHAADRDGLADLRFKAGLPNESPPCCRERDRSSGNGSSRIRPYGRRELHPLHRGPARRSWPAAPTR